MKCTLSITASVSALASLLTHLSASGADYDVEAPKLMVHESNIEPKQSGLITNESTAPVVTHAVAGVTAPTDPNATLDADGIPWDDRIHAGSKVTVADGTWRKKRGVDDTLYESVKAELKASVAPPMPAGDVVEQPTAPIVEQPTAPIVEQPTAPIVEQPTAPIVEQPTAPAPVVQTPPMPAGDIAPVAAPAVTSLDFSGFMQKIGKIMQTNSAVVNVDYLGRIKDEIATAFNSPLNAITDIAANQQMIDYAVQLMQRDQTWT